MLVLFFKENKIGMKMHLAKLTSELDKSSLFIMLFVHAGVRGSDMFFYLVHSEQESAEGNENTEVLWHLVPLFTQTRKVRDILHLHYRHLVNKHFVN